MATIQQLYDDHPHRDIIGSDTNAKRAANFALGVGARHGFLLTERIASAGTFATSTFSYAITGSLDRYRGVSEVFVNEATTTAPVRHRGLWQYFDESEAKWKLVFPPRIVAGYVGKTFDVTYQAQYPRLTAMTSEVNLPYEFAMWAMTMWVAAWKMNQQGVDPGHWANIYIDAQRQVNATRRPPGPRISEIQPKDRPA